MYSEKCYCRFAALAEKCNQKVDFENIQYWNSYRVFVKIGVNSFVGQVQHVFFGLQIFPG